MMVNKNTRRINITTSFFKSLLFTGLLIFFSGCSNNDKQKISTDEQQASFTFPQTTVLANLSKNNNPKEISLDNTVKPVSYIVPGKINTPVKIYNKDVLLSAPEIHAYINSTTGSPISVAKQGKGFFKTYSTDDGLTLDQVHCSYKDKNGNLWFGTNGGGVSKYDGKKFTNYTSSQGLANNVVWSIAEDKAGNLWFGTDGSGVSKFNGNYFTNYTTAQGLADNVVLSIKEDKNGNLWFGTLKSGVSKFNGKTFTTYTTSNGLANNAIRDILADNNGNLWFGTLGGVSKYDGKTFTNFSTDEGLANDKIRSIAQDKTGNIWFGTDGGGVCKYDGTEFTSYLHIPGLSNTTVWSITDDKKGNLWFGTDGKGAFKYDGTNFVDYTIAQGLANNSVRSVLEDDKGNLWISTFGGGLSKFAGNSFINYTTAQGLSNNVVYSIAEDKNNNLWFCTYGGGVCKYDGTSITNYTMAQGLANNVVYCIMSDKKGDLWFGTAGGGVSKFDGVSFTNYTMAQGLANNTVFSIVEDKSGNLWFGTSGGGVSKFDGKSFTTYTTVQGLANNVVFSIFEDKSANLWFGTMGGGVSKFDGRSFTNFTTAQGLSNNVIWSIAEDKTGNLWFGTQEGLDLLHIDKFTIFSEKNKSQKPFSTNLFQSFTVKDGLPDNFITQVVPGNDHKLYVGTNLGFCELIPSNTGNGTAVNWTVGKIFNSHNGYPVKDVNAGQHAMFKDSKGIFWIGTGSDKTGLVRFDPAAIINNNQTPPKVIIQQVKVNNEAVSWSSLQPNLRIEKQDSNTIAANITDEVTTFGRQLTDLERDSMRNKYKNISFDGISKWQPIPNKLVVPYYFNDISFDFNAIETGANFLVKYQHKLEGYSKDWSTPDYSTSAKFGNIYEGTHTFLLKAQNPEGIWSNPISYTFKVTPPWWRTWWMFIAYTLFVIAVIILLVWWNSRRIIAQKKRLEIKVKEATKKISEEKLIVEEQHTKIEETLTELKSTQAQLIQAEKMASLGELTAGIAHEIQNPLNFVNNFSEVSNELIDEMNIELDKGDIEEAKAIANDVKQNLVKINHHGKRADAIVKDMLQHSQSFGGKKESTDINALCAEYLNLTYHGLKEKDSTFNTIIKTDFEPAIENLNIIQRDIGRVVLNLINNAFYAVAEKKKLNITGYEPMVSIQTKLQAPSTAGEGRVAEISVSDNGTGIPQKLLDKIFQPFFTTKPTGQGTGLGLSLSYDIVKAHGGEIKVENREGEGTTFIISLPG